MFKFQDPDWKPAPNTPIDNLTGQPLRREFSLDSVKQLKSFIGFKIGQVSFNERGSIYYINMKQLYDRIQEGIAKKGDLSSINGLVKLYDFFNNEEKANIIFYLSWVFWLGLWMRFWRGPGYPWPITGGYTAKDRCNPDEREQNVFIENSVRDAIFDRFKNDERVNNFINSLPMVSYNYNTRMGSITSRFLNAHITSLISLGRSCMGFGGDETIDNSYYYLTTLLKLPNTNNDDGFHNIINQIIPQIINIEKASVEHLLKETNPEVSPEFKIKYGLLQERQNLLLKGYVPEKPFPIRNMSHNPHTY
jgi:hypothetical protein